MCLEASRVLVSVVQMLDNAVLVYFKHSSSIGYCHARTLCFYAKLKTTLAANRTGNTTESSSLPFIALLKAMC